MPTPKKGARLGGSPAHQKLILSNLAAQLIEHRGLTTTEAKAKLLRPYVEKLITKAKRGDQHARRTVLKKIPNKGIVAILFEELVPAMDSERAGGYTRLIRVGNRKGDNAPLMRIELVMEKVEKKAVVKAAEKTAEKAAASQVAAEAEEAAEARPAKENAYKQRKEQESAKRKLAGRIRRTEEEIAAAEEAVAALHLRLESEEVTADYERLLEVTGQLEAESRRLDELMEQWEQLQLEAEA